MSASLVQGRAVRGLPAFFRKASHSVTGPIGDIIRPDGVGFLDYEVELGLIIGAHLPVGTTVTEADLARYAAALVVANDVSARQVQLVKTQFYESKSYPTFTPAGPWLTLAGARLLARRTSRPGTLIAARRLADNPKAGFRAVSGLVLALFITTVAVALITTQNAKGAAPLDGPAASILVDQFSDNP